MQQLPAVQELKNILVVRGEGSLGDAVLSSVCYRALKKSNPHLRITIVAFASAVTYLQALPTVDEVYRLPITNVLRPNQRWPSLLWHAFKLRRRRFDLVMDSSCKDFYNWRLFKWIIGSDRVFDPLTRPGDFTPNVHASQREKEMACRLGAQDADDSYDLPILPPAQAKWNAFAKRHLSGEYILLNPFGSVQERCLNKGAFQSVLRALGAYGIACPVVVPFVPARRTQAEALWAGASYPVIGYETASLFDLFAAVQSARLVLTPDTAAVHIAAGFRRKTIAFYNNYTVYYGPNNPLAVPVFTARETVSRFNRQDVSAALRKLW